MIQIYGWGTTSFQGSSPDKLLEATVPVVTKETCQTKWPSVEDGMICAGGEEGTDTCQVRKFRLTLSLTCIHYDFPYTNPTQLRLQRGNVMLFGFWSDTSYSQPLNRAGKSLSNVSSFYYVYVLLPYTILT